MINKLSIRFAICYIFSHKRSFNNNSNFFVFITFFLSLIMLFSVHSSMNERFTTYFLQGLNTYPLALHQYYKRFLVLYEPYKKKFIYEWCRRLTVAIFLTFVF